MIMEVHTVYFKMHIAAKDPFSRNYADIYESKLFLLMHSNITFENRHCTDLGLHCTLLESTIVTVA